MTVIQKNPESPIAHLSDADIEALGKELDALRERVIDSRGQRDADYIRRLIDVQRSLELASRGILLFSLFPPAWVVGTTGLSLSKILENMEIGHNVLHGQWDWMRPGHPLDHLGVGQRHLGGHVEALLHELHHVHQRARQGQRPRLRHHARR